MSLKNFTNEVLKSNRIFSREDIGKMTSDDFRQNEKAIDFQIQKIGAPTDDELSKSADVVYVHAYTRADGTEVSAHYRSRPDGKMKIPGDFTTTTQDDTDIFKSRKEDLKIFISNALKKVFPNYQNIEAITKLLSDRILPKDPTTDSPDKDPEASAKKMRENIIRIVSQILPEGSETMAFIENLNKYVLDSEIFKTPTDEGPTTTPGDNENLFGLDKEDLKIFVTSALQQILPNNQNVEAIAELISEGISSISSPDSLDKDPEASREKIKENILKIVSQILPQSSETLAFVSNLDK